MLPFEIKHREPVGVQIYKKRRVVVKTAAEKTFVRAAAQDDTEIRLAVQVGGASKTLVDLKNQH